MFNILYFDSICVNQIYLFVNSTEIANASRFNFSLFNSIILSEGCGDRCRSSGPGPSEGVQDSQRPICSVTDFAL